MDLSDSKSTIEVTVNRGSENEQRITFLHSFKIGRASACDIQLRDSVVSAHHLEILYESGKWWVHDLHSTNGTFVDGELVSKKRLDDRATIQLGKGGPIVSFKVKAEGALQRSLFGQTVIGTIFKALPSSTQVFQHYFSKKLPKSVGQYTMHIRQAFDHAVKRRGRNLFWVIGILLLVTMSTFAMLWRQHGQLAKLEPLATEIFYNMKSLELQINRFTQTIADSKDENLIQEVTAMQQKHQQLRDQYDNFVGQLGVYDENVDEQERLILRIARVFGECELNAPEDFVNIVKKYIKRWQSTQRLQIAISRGFAYGYQKIITEEFLAQSLPPQFIYLALQESNFDVNKSGPKTKYGIAKGMWQFIPRTATAYGLKVGPLRRVRRADPKDERHDSRKSTQAAAKLIRDLYHTKAQGSGLLVLASYNWGIGNLGRIIDQMPQNPRERNFWNLLKQHDIPQETYDFVFYIISAAVIGENPQLFGYTFKNLLAEVS